MATGHVGEHMKEYGLAGAGVGGLVLGLSFFMETTAPYSDVVNLQLMQIQMMAWQGGLALIIAGAVIYAAGEILEQVKRMVPSDENDEDEDEKNDTDYFLG